MVLYNKRVNIIDDLMGNTIKTVTWQYWWPECLYFKPY